MRIRFRSRCPKKQFDSSLGCPCHGPQHHPAWLRQRFWKSGDCLFPDKESPVILSFLPSFLFVESVGIWIWLCLFRVVSCLFLDTKWAKQQVVMKSTCSECGNALLHAQAKASGHSLSKNKFQSLPLQSPQKWSGPIYHSKGLFRNKGFRNHTSHCGRFGRFWKHPLILKWFLWKLEQEIK